MLAAIKRMPSARCCLVYPAPPANIVCLSLRISINLNHVPPCQPANTIFFRRKSTPANRHKPSVRVVNLSGN
jgi:hypothetical protein